MKHLRLCVLALLFSLSFIATSPNEAKACSGTTNLRALEICYQKCRDLYPGDSLWTVAARTACFGGCQLGCIIYGTE